MTFASIVSRAWAEIILESRGPKDVDNEALGGA